MVQTNLVEKYRNAIAKAKESQRSFIKWNDCEKNMIIAGKVVSFSTDQFGNKHCQMLRLNEESEKMETVDFKMPKALLTHFTKQAIKENDSIVIKYGGLKEFQGVEFHSFFVEKV